MTILLLTVTTTAQVPTMPTPAPRPGSRQGNLNPVSADSVNFDRLRSIELMVPKERSEDHPILDPKKGIYRKPSREEIEPLAIGESILSSHSQFLRGTDTGIVKLNGEPSCVSVDDVVVASEKCVAFKMPGAGTAYSFRTESYRLPRLADVILFDNVFWTGGVYQQVVLANIGEVPLDNVTLATKGIKYLLDLQPARDSDEFTKFDKLIADGVVSDGILYRKGQPVREGATFALRSIAYRGEYIRAADGVQYNELEFDKRRDVVVAFRVVDKDDHGNLTIIWKRLRDVEAPKLKVKK